MPELTPYKVRSVTITFNNPPRLKFNAGGVLYVKGMTDHGGVEVRFPADISVSEDITGLNYGVLVRADQPITKPARETTQKPVRENKPENAPVQAEKPQSPPEKKDIKTDGPAKRKLNLFKL